MVWGVKREDDAPDFGDIVTALHKAGITHARRPNREDRCKIIADTIEAGNINDFFFFMEDRRGVISLEVTPEYIYKCVNVTIEDLETIPPEFRKQIKEAMGAYAKRELEPRQEKISVTRIEKRLLRRCGENENLPWSSYTIKAALKMASLSNGLSDKIGEQLRIDEIEHLARQGRKLQDAFTPDEVTQAMDVAGISPSQAVKLMAELERLRDARKSFNPDPLSEAEKSI
jgi:hypothetical protein